MKHIFIINPAAGGGDADGKYLAQIIKAVKSAGVEYELHRSLNATDITSWVRQKAQLGDHVRFYAVGGDGTVNDVVSGMVGYEHAELAVIPCGTGNDYVKNWTDQDKNLLVEELMNGKVVKSDIIKFGDSYSINMLNIGADCDVVVEAKKMKKLKGAASYLAGALKVIPQGPIYSMKYSIDDGPEEEGDFLLMCIANGAYCGGGFYSCPKASIQDGKMDLCLVKPVKGVKIIPLILKYREGKHLNHPKTVELVKYVQCEKFKLTALKPVNVSKDGEVEEFTSSEFTVLKQAVNLVIPQSSNLVK